MFIHIYSVIKLYMFRASSLPIIKESPTVHSAMVIFMQVYDDRFQAESGCNCISRMYSRRLLMMGKEDVRNM
jgi:hypothetical protein